MSYTREQAIHIIEHLFPADSPHFAVRSVGNELLEQARRDAIDWRTEPTGVLQRYAALCEEKENRMATQAIRNAERGL